MLALERRSSGESRTPARWLAAATTLPLLTRTGIGVLMVGFVVDVVAHAFGPAGTAAAIGHLVTLAGMGLALAGALRLATGRPTADGPGGRRSP